MTKADLVKLMAEEAGVTKKAAEAALNAFVRAIHDSLKKQQGKIRIADLGTFKVARTKARTGVNPQTMQKIKISASKVTRFSASKALKEAINKPKAHAGLPGRPTTPPSPRPPKK